MNFSRLLAGACIALLLCSPASAHKASDAYLELRPDGTAIDLRWDIALRDLDQVLDLDRDGDNRLSWREILQGQPAILAHAFESLELATAAGPCRAGSVTHGLARRQDGTYAVLRWRAECPQAPSEVAVRYRFLLDIDPTHRALVSSPAAEVALTSLRPGADMQSIGLRPAQAGAGRVDLAGFFAEGFGHILDGYDHLAFLLALLIPAIAVAAVDRRRLGVATGELLAVVSVFTLAHSVTLGLTALNHISLPSRFVESVIALSVVVAALQGLLVGKAATTQGVLRAGPLAWRPGAVPLWLVFAFGLIHGMGFGAALGDAGFSGRTALSALLGFNLGVEAGQLAVLAVAFPVAWALRSTAAFQRVLLPGAALSIVAAGSIWFLARAFGVDLVAAVVAG